MAETLFFRQVESAYEWLRFNGQGQLIDQGISELTALTVDGRAVLVVPGTDILRTAAAVPSRQYRQIVQAVPYVIEENLAMDVEDCFFALGDRNSDGDIEVAVVAEAQMSAWVRLIEESGLEVMAIVAEHDLVNADSESFVLLDGTQAHIDLEGSSSATLPGSEIALSTTGLEEGAAISVWANDSVPAAIDLQLKELEAAGFSIQRQTSEESPFERLCRGYGGNAINLLQGAFKRKEKRTEGFNIWRSVAVLTLAAVLLHVVSLVGQGWYLQAKAAEFEAETQAIYKKAFPNDRNVRDIRRRWNSHLGKSDSADNVFISLLSRSTRQLSTSGLSLSNINFNESRGDLVLQVIGKRSEELVEYAQRLSGQGLDAEIGTITQESGGVRGSIRVRDAS